MFESWHFHDLGAQNVGVRKYLGASGSPSCKNETESEKAPNLKWGPGCIAQDRHVDTRSTPQVGGIGWRTSRRLRSTWPCSLRSSQSPGETRKNSKQETGAGSLRREQLIGKLPVPLSWFPFLCWNKASNPTNRFKVTWLIYGTQKFLMNSKHSGHVLTRESRWQRCCAGQPKTLREQPFPVSLLPVGNLVKNRTCGFNFCGWRFGTLASESSESGND